MRKRKKLAIAVISALSAATLAVGVSCTTKKTSDGSEYGVYYYEWDGEEYLVTLSEGEKFTFYVDGTNRAGTYTLDEGKLTLKFGKKEELEAEMKADVLTLNYNNSEMRFLKRTAYRVEFEENGGSEIASVRVINGKTLARPEESVKDGYTFIGWYADAEYTKPFIFGSDIITGDTTLYAYWVQNTGAAEYVVNFDLNYENAESVASRTTVGGKLYEMPEAEREGYEFKGWWVSQYNDAKKLSYLYTGGVLTEDTTLYAVWKEAGSRKLDAPVVRIEPNRIVWDGVSGATGYRVVVTDASGKELLNTSGSLSVNFEFGKQAAGDYVVRVTAIASASANNAESEIHYKNKALSKVSSYSVVEGTTLLYGAVEKAEHYIITVECGNAHHKHSEFDNGTATSYNFTNCTPKADGKIKFTVVATAEGYATGEASSYEYSKVLQKIERLYTDSATDTVSWDGVAAAVRYIVVVNGKRIDVGTKTSYSLAEYDAGEIEVSVYPETEGYISPEATSVKYEKTSVAKPTELKIVGEILTWKAVSGATYEVRVNDANGVSADRNEFDLSAYNLTQDRDHVIAVRAIKGSNVSSWTEITVRSNAMSERLRYAGGKVSWTLAIGATEYEVSVNGRVQTKVTDGSSEAEVRLERAGTNVIGVRYTDGANVSVEASIEVYAHRVYYYSNGGAGSEEQYKAVGDPMTPPEVTKAGYDFEGWYNVPGGADSNGKKYEDDTFRGTGEIVLYAYYTPKTYKAALNAEGGILDATSAEVVYHTSDFKFAVPTASSATDAFDGWYTLPNGAGTRLTDADGNAVNRWEIAEDAEIYANWINDVFEYELLEDGTYSVTKGTNIGSLTSITIPETYNGKPVTVVEGYAFDKSYSLVSVSIPDTVKIIETNTAFNSCYKLQRVDIYAVDGNTSRTYWSEEGVIFAYNDVTAATEIAYVPAAMTGEFVIPDGVTTIPMKAFSGTKITSVTIPTSVTSIEMNAFYNCRNLSSVEFTAGGTGELTISEKAFNSCIALTSITLPARTGKFETNTFDSCTSLKAIHVEAGNQYYSSVDGMLCSADGSVLIYAPAGTSGRITVPVGVTAIGDGAFYNNMKLTQVNIPGYVTSIGASAFFNNASLRSIVFQGNAVEDLTIGASAFSGCLSLRTVTFEETCRVAEIGEKAFYMCSGFRDLSFPASLHTVKNNAFEGCTSLRTIIFAGGDSELTFGSGVFNLCDALTSVRLSKNVKAFNLGVFSGCTYLDTITVDPENSNFSDDNGILYNRDRTELLFYPRVRSKDIVFADKIEVIGNGIFEGYEEVTSVTIPASVTKIGENAFKGCKFLATLNFEAGSKLEIIGDSAFASTGLTYGAALENRELAIPASVKKIGDSAFAMGSTNKLNGTLSFGDGSVLEEIGEKAFYYCNFTGTITVPATVKKLGTSAFSGCKSVEHVVFAEGSYMTGEDWGTQVFSRCENLLDIVLPQGMTVLKQATFSGNYKMAAPKLPDTLVTIGDTVFSQVGGFTEFTVPASVKTIGKSAFAGGGTAAVASHLKVMRFEEGSLLESIGSLAFSHCVEFTTINLGANVKSIASDAFRSTAFTSFTVAEENQTFKTIDNILYSKDGKKLIFAPTTIQNVIIPGEVTEIADYAFGSLGTGAVSPKTTQLRTVTFEAGTENLKIGAVGTNSYAFQNCTYLETITIPARTVSIGRNAFVGCTGLTSVLFEGVKTAASGEATAEGDDETEATAEPSRLTTIDNLAFSKCSALSSFVIPKSVTKIGEKIFSGCTGLKSIAFEEGTAIEDIGTGFAGISKVTSKEAAIVLTVPNTVKTLTKGAFQSSSNIKEVIFESDCKITAIPTLAFCDSGITKIHIPKSVQAIEGPKAFGTCKQLTEITFEENSALQSIGTTAFVNCTELLSVTEIPNSVKTIASSFMGCAKLQTVTFESCTESNLESLGDSAFSGAFKTSANPVELKLPVGLKQLGKEVFKSAVKLKSVDFGANKLLKEFGGSAFDGCTNLEKIVFPKSFTGFSGTNCFRGCTKFTTAEVSESLSAEAGITVTDNVIYRDGLLVLYPLGKADASFTIPANVTAIGHSAFFGAINLTSLTIPSAVETIGDYAFAYCTGIKSVTFADGDSALTIGERAFYYCTGINTAISFPSRVSAIKKEAFAGGSKAAEQMHVPSVTFKENCRLTTLANALFNNNVDLAAVNNVPKGVTAIEANAFANCEKLQTFTFEDGSLLDSIAGSAFSGAFKTCEAEASIALPASLTSLGDSVFKGATKLTSVSFGKNSRLTQLGKTVFENSGIKEIVIPSNVGNMGISTFLNCASLESVTFEDGSALTAIGNQTFKNCGNLVSIDFGEDSKIETFGTDVFYDCVKLKEVRLPESVTALGNKVFMNCSELTKVDIFDKLVTIGDDAFKGCGKLSEISLPASLEALGANVFMGCDSLTSFHISDACMEYVMVDGILYNADLSVMVYLPLGISGEITIPDTVMEITDGAFSGTAVTKVTMPYTVMKVGVSLFQDCKELTEVVLHSRIQSIDANAFKGCEKLQSITIPGSVSMIDTSAFEGCTSLRKVIFEEGREAMRFGNAAFKNCVSLESIEIPARVRSSGSNFGIGDSCFEGCEKLATVEFEADEQELFSGALPLGASAFKGCVALTEITMPKQVQDFLIALTYFNAVGNSCFEGCTKLQSVTFLAAEQGIAVSFGTNAFKGCEKLAQLNFSEKAKEFGANAFDGCTSLAQITLPATVTTLGANVFSGWTATQTVTMSIAESAVPSTWDVNWRTGCEANIVWATA